MEWCPLLKGRADGALDQSGSSIEIILIVEVDLGLHMYYGLSQPCSWLTFVGHLSIFSRIYFRSSESHWPWRARYRSAFIKIHYVPVVDRVASLRSLGHMPLLMGIILVAAPVAMGLATGYHNKILEGKNVPPIQSDACSLLSIPWIHPQWTLHSDL